MIDRLSALADDILCYTLSILPLRDSIRTRLLSARWRYLLDDRLVLKFDTPNVFGSEYRERELDSMPEFVSAVDQVLELRKGRNHRALIFDFVCPNIQASVVDRWVESGIKMKIETLELWLCSNSYGVPDKIFQSFHSRNAFHLKSLHLFSYCDFALSSESTSWISHLTTLELANVPLDPKDIECVVSHGLNLTSILLHRCADKDFFAIAVPINVELPRLKKLNVYGCECFKQVELNCPNLESFVCVDQEGMDLKFSHVPLLKIVNLRNTSHSPNCSLMFEELARDTPKLRELSFYLMTEVQPLSTLWCLKRLDLNIQGFDETGFDLFTVTYLLNASPFLEILHLQKWRLDNNELIGVRVRQTEYPDNPHDHLKEVKIDRFKRSWNEIEFTRYLLKNAVVLERMILVDSCYCSSAKEMGNNDCHPGTTLSYATVCRFPSRVEMDTSYCSLRREEMAKILLQDLETSAELVFTIEYIGVVLNASNRVGYGLHLFRPDLIWVDLEGEGGR